MAKINESTKQLDLFKLHSKSDTPDSWIWVKLNSHLLRKKYFKLLKNNTQKDVARQLNKELKAGLSTVEKHLGRLRHAGDNICLPLPIIIKIVGKDISLKHKIINSFDSFILKTDTTRKITKAIKCLNSTLATIIGAFLADGYSKKEGNSYKIKITDGQPDSIKKLSAWIENEFNIKPRIRYYEDDHTWNCFCNSKVLGRYIENIFDISPGKKALIVKEPLIIKQANIVIRKAFVKGVMMFDGCIKSSGTISLTSISKQLIEDVCEILLLDDIEVNKTYNHHNGSWLIESKTGRNKAELNKWKNYFEIGTWKYERLQYFLSNKKHSIGSITNLFPSHPLSKVSVQEVYDALEHIKSGKIRDIVSKLNDNGIHIANTTLYKYIHLLEKSMLINKEREYHTSDKNGWIECVYHLGEIKCRQ